MHIQTDVAISRQAHDWVRSNAHMGDILTTQSLGETMGLPPHERGALSGFLFRCKEHGLTKVVAKQGKLLVHEVVDPHAPMVTFAFKGRGSPPLRPAGIRENMNGLPQLRDLSHAGSPAAPTIAPSALSEALLALATQALSLVDITQVPIEALWSELQRRHLESEQALQAAQRIATERWTPETARADGDPA